MTRSPVSGSVWWLACAACLLLLSPLTARAADDPAVGKRFPSPDGRRVLYLKLIRNDEGSSGGLAGVLGLTRKPAPSLAVEYSMVRGTTEVIIRPFVVTAAAALDARYRVVWDDEDQRVMVLCDQPPQQAGRREKAPIAWGKEFVVFFYDRVKEVFPPSQEFVTADWNAARLRAGSESTVLPALIPDFKKPLPREHAGKTGEIRTVQNRPGSRERVGNFIVHSNTQNLRKGDDRALFRMPPTRLATPSPDRKLEARWLEDSASVIVLAEGDVFRDQLWVLRFETPGTSFDPGSQKPREYRFAWTKDSRHLLLLTRDSGQSGLTRLPSGEEVLFVFDTRDWDGVSAPGSKELAGLDLAP